ncbi:MAG: N-acetylmuramoyl-L-alanine amidase, partial [Francisellaceae bacterium]|nr:N-acetylmuramoyl-L-alanine amidase [Francisellaceae bacterium]
MWDRQCRIILLLIKVIIGLIFFIPSIAIASSPFLEDIRLNTEKGSTRIVLEHSHSIKYDLTEDIKQKKIIVQLSQTHYKAHFLKKLNALALKNSPIKKLVLNNKNNKLYVIIYLKNRQLTKIYKLAANKKQKNRIVIDLTNIPTESVAKSLSKITNTLTPKPIPYKNKIIKNNKKFIIAIDAGHGGSDPGAIGRSGLREKDVVIKIAKYLKKLLDKEPNLQAVLIRQGDYYVGLQDRVRFARGKK